MVSDSVNCLTQKRSRTWNNGVQQTIMDEHDTVPADLARWSLAEGRTEEAVGLMKKKHRRKKDKHFLEKLRDAEDRDDAAAAEAAEAAEAASTAFAAERKAKADAQLKEREAAAAQRDRRPAPSAEQIERTSELFWKFDEDVSGALDREEYLNLVHKAGGVLTDAEAEAAFARADKDGSGTLELKEISRSKTLVATLGGTGFDEDEDDGPLIRWKGGAGADDEADAVPFTGASPTAPGDTTGGPAVSSSSHGEHSAWNRSRHSSHGSGHRRSGRAAGHEPPSGHHHHKHHQRRKHRRKHGHSESQQR